jgi:murein tripeptide amidase MpaA
MLDADLDGGSIVIADASRAPHYELLLRPDNANPSFKQWFFFRHRGARGRASTYRIGGIADATFPDAFDGYRAAASYDLEEWFRVPTEWSGDALTIRHTPERDVVHYAYFAAYSFARHASLIAHAARSPRVRAEVIGRSVEDRPMSLLAVGDEENRSLRRVWVCARQHPGETMAAWFMEGMIGRLLDEQDELTSALLARAVFYLVPSMNPDGGVLGNLRTNARGRDMNRSWTDPDRDETPEVACVRARMFDVGVDLFLDIHGDERNPYVFAAGCEGNPSYSDRIAKLEDLFAASLVELDGDFQREYGYPRDPPGEADLRTAGNFVGEAFDCLSLTLEMPFKDNANHPDPTKGWSPERARHFGRTTLESVFVCADRLR